MTYKYWITIDEHYKNMFYSVGSKRSYKGKPNIFVELLYYLNKIETHNLIEVTVKDNIYTDLKVIL